MTTDGFERLRPAQLALSRERLPLLAGLRSFTELVRELRGKAHPAQERVAELRRIHADLVSSAAAELPPEPHLLVAADAERAFAAGALLLARYEGTVLSDLPLIDTVGSATLTDFQVDFPDSPENRRRLRAALEGALGFGPERLAELVLALRPELEELELRHAVMAALDGLHPIRETQPGAGSVDERVLALFERLFPDQVYRPGEVGLIRTGTSLFFCAALPGSPPFEAALAARAPAERAELCRFAARFGQARPRDYENFPVFGRFRGWMAERALLAELARATGLDSARVAEVLQTMVAVLPLHQVDQYVVHDAWGHPWQAALLAFEEAYGEMAGFEDPPALESVARARDGAETSFEEALAEAVAAVAASERPGCALFDRFVLAEMTHRLVTSMAGVVSEILADVVEYKYLTLRPEYAERLLSSSFFKQEPVKLDLTCTDLGDLFALARRGFERLAEDPAVGEQLARDFCARHPGARVDHVATAVALLARRTRAWLDWVFAPELLWEETDAGLAVNLCGHAALHLAGLAAVLGTVVRALEAEELPADVPLRGGLDLLVLSTAAFYEEDRERNFWLLDEYLALHFGPAFRRLVRALAE